LQQLVELQAAYDQFRSRHAEIWAIAFQDVSRAQTMAGLVKAGYPILADVNHAVADAYGVFNLLNDGVATPAVFVVDPAGRIVWSYIGKSTTDRPSPDEILKHLPQ
jgi:peroxiredoxin Q/BCP